MSVVAIKNYLLILNIGPLNCQPFGAVGDDLLAEVISGAVDVLDSPHR